jgi:hypothetical protein
MHGGRSYGANRWGLGQSSPAMSTCSLPMGRRSRSPPIRELMGPSQGRWGVLQVLFPIPVMDKNDIARNFDVVLPLLKQHYAARLSNGNENEGV